MLIIFSDLFNENTFFPLQFKYIQLFSGYRDIYNIRSLSENKKLFVRALERGKIASPWQAFLAFFTVSGN